MSVNLVDPKAIMNAYKAVVDGQLDWLLLHYSAHSSEDLSLLSFGSQGLEELKTKVYDIGRVFIGFYREEVETNPGYVVIAYIPSSISGVWRARALVHSRRLCMLFKKHQTMFSVESLSDLTISNVTKALRDPDHTSSSSMGRSFSQPTDLTNRGPTHLLPIAPLRKSSSEHSPRPAPTQTYVVHELVKTGGIFSKIMKPKKRQDQLPPPTPVKDTERAQSGNNVHRASPAIRTYDYAAARPLLGRQNSMDNSGEPSTYAHDKNGRPKDVPPELPLKDPVHAVPLQGKWDPRATGYPSPEERTRLRQEAQRRKEQEEKEAVLLEAARQEEMRKKKADALRREQEEEQRRKALVEAEIKRVAVERRKKEEMAKQVEVRERSEMEERRRRERERRMEEHRRLEEWREQRARQAEEASRQAEREKKKDDEERNMKIKLVETIVKHSPNPQSLLRGWVTLQPADSVFWKRRYFQFKGTIMYLYRSPKELHQPLDKVELRGTVRSFKEWHEGYEDLEAIPFSFVIEFNDDRQAWSMYADSEEDKYKILGLLHHAAGL